MVRVWRGGGCCAEAGREKKSDSRITGISAPAAKARRLRSLSPFRGPSGGEGAQERRRRAFVQSIIDRDAPGDAADRDRDDRLAARRGDHRGVVAEPLRDGYS